MQITLSTGETVRQAESMLIRKGVPTATSGKEGQTLVRCPDCFTVVYIHYLSGGTLFIIRVGTLDGVVDVDGAYVPSGGLRPHAHIFAGDGKAKKSNRHRWFPIPEGSVVFEEYGPQDQYWPQESLERIAVFTMSNVVTAPIQMKEKIIFRDEQS